ncbi:hypothetical protein ACVFYP_22215 [Roseomonas sp. F4]
MPVTDVRVTLRVAGSDHLLPRALQGTAIAIEATIQDQDGAALPGAIADLSWVAPDGVEMRQEGCVADAGGVARGRLAVAPTGYFVARCVITSPVLRVVERRFEMRAGAVALDAVPATPVVTPNGTFLILPNGMAIGGPLA